MSPVRSQDWDPKSAAVLGDQRAAGINPIAQCPPTRAVYPASGFATLPLHIKLASQPVVHHP